MSYHLIRFSHACMCTLFEIHKFTGLDYLSIHRFTDINGPKGEYTYNYNPCKPYKSEHCDTDKEVHVSIIICLHCYQLWTTLVLWCRQQACFLKLSDLVQWIEHAKHAKFVTNKQIIITITGYRVAKSALINHLHTPLPIAVQRLCGLMRQVHHSSTIMLLKAGK